MHRKIKWQQPGDTLLEVVVALVLLSSILIATFTILNRAIDTNVNVKNRIIALNIAREGVEAVRNLRDTNWLKYSGDRRGKWLCYDSSGSPNACNGSTTTLLDDGSGTFYKIDYDTTVNRYYLAPGLLSETLDLTSGTQTQTNQDSFRLNLDTGTNRYTHDTGLGSQSIFYRQLYLQAINPYHEQGTKPSFCDSNADEPDCFYGRLNAQVSVYWMEDGRPRRVSLEADLFDFFERSDYN